MKPLITIFFFVLSFFYPQFSSAALPVCQQVGALTVAANCDNGADVLLVKNPGGEFFEFSNANDFGFSLAEGQYISFDFENLSTNPSCSEADYVVDLTCIEALPIPTCDVSLTLTEIDSGDEATLAFVTNIDIEFSSSYFNLFQYSFFVNGTPESGYYDSGIQAFVLEFSGYPYANGEPIEIVLVNDSPVIGPYCSDMLEIPGISGEDYPFPGYPEGTIVKTICAGESATIGANEIGAFGPPPDIPTCSGCYFSISPNYNVECNSIVDECFYAAVSPDTTTLYTMNYIDAFGNIGEGYFLIEVEYCGSSADAGILGMFEDDSFLYEGSKEIKVLLQNFGEGQLDQVEINWMINDQIQTSMLYSGPILSAYESDEVVIQNYFFYENTNYEMKFWTSNPNGGIDANTLNDTIYSTIYIQDLDVNPNLVESADAVYKICQTDTVSIPFPDRPNGSNCGLLGAPHFDFYSITPEETSMLGGGANVFPDTNTLYTFFATYQYSTCIPFYYLSREVYVVVEDCDPICENPYELNWMFGLFDILDASMSDCVCYEIKSNKEYSQPYYHLIVSVDDNPNCPNLEKKRIKYNCRGNIVETVSGYYATLNYEPIIYSGKAESNPNCDKNSGLIYFDNCDNGDLYFFIETEGGLILDPYYADGIDFEHFDGMWVDFDYYLADFESPCSNATAVIVTCIREKPRSLYLKCFLEGAQSIDVNSTYMTSELFEEGLLPLDQPFSNSPYFYNVNDTLRVNSYDKVDWLLVELRSGVPDLNEPGTNIEKSQAAILRSNGGIMPSDSFYSGGALRFYGIAEGESYYVVVRHRNHLDVISAQPITFNLGEPTAYDFTTSADKAFGPDQLKEMPNGTFALYAGDYNGDGVIQITDFDVWRENPAALDTYSAADGNLDGTIQVTDFDKWQINKSKLGVVEIRY